MLTAIEALTRARDLIIFHGRVAQGSFGRPGECVCEAGALNVVLYGNASALPSQFEFAHPAYRFLARAVGGNPTHGFDPIFIHNDEHAARDVSVAVDAFNHALELAHADLR